MEYDMRQGSARTDTALRTTCAVRPWMHKPQPITEREVKAAAEALTPEECRRVVGIALRRKWLWYKTELAGTTGVLRGESSQPVNSKGAKPATLRDI